MKIEKPLVSIIIPVYNTEEYLEECLESVLNQTLKEIEVICIDDKSTDKSLEILLKYAKKDNRLKVIKNERNTGQAIAKNICLKELNGEYVSFLDSDDKIDRDAYEKLYDFSKNFKQDIILFNMVRFDEKKIWESELHVKSITESIEKTDLIQHPEFIYDTTACNKFIKTSFLMEKNINFIDRLYEDILFSMQLITSTNSIGVYKDVNYYWRRRTNSNKSTTQERTNIKNIRDRIFIVKEIIELFNSKEEYKNLINDLYKKLVEIDFRLYINKMDKADSEYKNIIISEIIPILKIIPAEIFEDLDEMEKLKYYLLINEKIEHLCFIICKEKEHKKLVKQNNRLNEEMKIVKSTKGWLNYKINNIYSRL